MLAVKIMLTISEQSLVVMMTQVIPVAMRVFLHSHHHIQIQISLINHCHKYIVHHHLNPQAHQ
jgi:hypothetical protein